jgi:hypothetical protein
MKIELLHIADCPNAEAARQLLKETLRELGLPEEIQKIEVSDCSQAEAIRFPGSPTVRVDDRDVDTLLPAQSNYALSCRTYLVNGTLLALPTSQMIRNAIGLALSPSDTEAKRS